MSINTFLDKINNKYCNINCDEWRLLFGLVSLAGEGNL
jgi:hypothetical protein